MKNIIIVGFFYDDYTEIAKLISQKLGMMFFSLEQKIIEHTGKSSIDLLQERGKHYLEIISRKIITSEFDYLRNVVIAVPGEVLTSLQDFNTLKDHGWIIGMLMQSEDFLARATTGSDFRFVNKDRDMLLDMHLHAKGILRMADVVITLAGAETAFEADQTIQKITELRERELQ